ASAQLDDAPRPPPGAGRPLDLAGPAGLHPTPPCPPRDRRRAPALGAPAAPDPASTHPGSRPAGLAAAARRPRHAPDCAKTLRPLARTPAWGALGAGALLSGPQESGLISTPPLPYPKISRSLSDRSATAGLNRKLRAVHGLLLHHPAYGL